MSEIAHLKPKKAAELVVQVMEALAGEDAWLSLEGFTVPAAVYTLPGVVTAETSILRRNTTSPVLQFVVVPLTRTNVTALKAAVSEAAALSDEQGLIHIQVAKAGQLAFGAYDNVHEECTVLYEPYSRSLSEALVRSGAATSFTLANRGG